MIKQSFIFLYTIVTTVYGHGLLTLPSSKSGGTLYTPHLTAGDHFALASYGIVDKAFFDGDHSITPWIRPGEFKWRDARDVISAHPQTLHPCGCNSGGIAQCIGVITAKEFGETTHGTVIPPEWPLGSSQDVAWNAWVNHAGGDVFMLCKKSEFDECRDNHLGDNPLVATTQQKESYLDCVWNCFESETLEFADTDQKLQFKDDPCTYVTMDAVEKVGEHGNYRFTPIVDSLQVTNGKEGVCMWDSATSFSNEKAREEFTESFGTSDICDTGKDAHSPSNWHVFDTVKVPDDLEEGEYLLSWRWDAYTADQMWTNCADVKIVASSASVSNDEVECLTNAPTSTPQPTPVTEPTPGTPPTPAFYCPEGYTGKRPYDNCKKYYFCTDGAFSGGPMPCADVYLFDFGMQNCNWKELVTCETDDENDDGEPCWSNNLKECNPEEFQSANDSYYTAWLPNGKRSSCIALWGDCTGQTNNCCEPAKCTGNQCRCIRCDNEPDGQMKKKNKTCDHSNYIKKKCNKTKKWKKKKYCQLGCFNLNKGYNGDVCCNGTKE